MLADKLSTCCRTSRFSDPERIAGAPSGSSESVKFSSAALTTIFPRSNSASKLWYIVFWSAIVAMGQPVSKPVDKLSITFVCLSFSLVCLFRFRFSQTMSETGFLTPEAIEEIRRQLQEELGEREDMPSAPRIGDLLREALTFVVDNVVACPLGDSRVVNWGRIRPPRTPSSSGPRVPRICPPGHGDPVRVRTGTSVKVLGYFPVIEQLGGSGSPTESAIDTMTTVPVGLLGPEWRDYDGEIEDQIEGEEYLSGRSNTVPEEMIFQRGILRSTPVDGAAALLAVLEGMLDQTEWAVGSASSIAITEFLSGTLLNAVPMEWCWYRVEFVRITYEWRCSISGAAPVRQAP